jgi:Uma2 family endonuclease
MSPLHTHEHFKKRLAWILEIVSDELEIPQVAAGSTTFNKQLLDRGLEPDESYYFASLTRLRQGRHIDLNIEPPPDLAVEVEITSGVLERMPIYAALGVPEVWRCDGTDLTVHVLGPEGSYGEAESSGTLPFLPMDEVAAFLFGGDPRNDMRWRQGFLAWVRDSLLPRYEAWREAEGT